VLAIIGPSGSGKSTLLHCLAGILLADSGSVSFRGQNLAMLSAGERSKLRRKDFGFVFQFGQLVSELTAEENVALPLILSGMKRSKALAVGRDRLAELGLAKIAAKKPGTISGGEAQRVAVAKSLAAVPTVIFADEPTGALDTSNGEIVLDALLGHGRDAGAAIILVTHDREVAARASHVLHLRDGAVQAEVGS
jgi:putative ABC transport system ATP-binding protein